MADGVHTKLRRRARKVKPPWLNNRKRNHNGNHIFYREKKFIICWKIRYVISEIERLDASLIWYEIKVLFLFCSIIAFIQLGDQRPWKTNNFRWHAEDLEVNPTDPYDFLKLHNVPVKLLLFLVSCFGEWLR